MLTGANSGSGYNDDMTARCRTPSQLMITTSSSQFDSGLFTQQDHQAFQTNTYDNRMGLALCPPESCTSFQEGLPEPNLNPFEDWPSTREKGDDFLPEEEIHIRSHELLEHDDMRHLLRLFSMGGHAAMNAPEDGFSFPGFGFGEDQARSGKAVVGWLKIKAAMRWGIFIRKKAAERRVQLVELEDD